jgi:hypothetical protein
MNSSLFFTSKSEFEGNVELMKPNILNKQVSSVTLVHLVGTEAKLSTNSCELN